MKRFLAALFLTLCAAQLTAAGYKPTVGMQTWTLRNMTFEQVVKFCADEKIKELEVIANHMNPMAPAEETRAKKKILEKNGLHVYTFGVAETSLDKEQNRKLFEFAKLMGIKVIVVEPKDFKILDNLEELVKEYNIKIAIHNHGITSTYGNPETVKNLLKNRDKRIGVCLDVGHVTGAGFDAAKVFREYEGRVYDIHLKDKHVVKNANGSTAIQDVKVGTGDSNYAGLFKELKKAHWKGVMAIETDNGAFAKEPREFVESAVKFVDESARSL